jgi:hypothetical protein
MVSPGQRICNIDRTDIGLASMKIHRHVPILRRLYASRDQALRRSATFAALHKEALAKLDSLRAERDRAMAERDQALTAKDGSMTEIGLIRAELRRVMAEKGLGQDDRMTKYRQRPFIVVMAVARSGSTLLQGVLNSIPGCLVRGENGAFVLGLMQAHEALCFAKNHSSSFTTPTDSWFGCEELDADRLLADFAHVAIDQLLGSRRHEDFAAIGFKEIRWLQRDLGAIPLWGVLRFIDAMFADARFILLTRSIDEILQSTGWPIVATSTTRYEIEQFYAGVRAAPIRKLFEVDYSDLHENSDAIRRLAEFVGSRYPLEADRVFAIQHGSDLSLWNQREQEITRLRAMVRRGHGQPA